jgi:hypothetical protein
MSAERRKGPTVSPQEWRLFWLVTLVLAVLTGGITALSTWLGRPEEPKNLLPSQSPFKTDVADTIPKTILLSDFDLPAPGGQWLSKSWLYSREGGNRPWSAAEIAPYWVPVDQLSVARLPQENARKIEKLFGEVR